MLITHILRLKEQKMVSLTFWLKVVAVLDIGEKISRLKATWNWDGQKQKQFIKNWFLSRFEWFFFKSSLTSFTSKWTLGEKTKMRSSNTMWRSFYTLSSIATVFMDLFWWFTNKRDCPVPYWFIVAILFFATIATIT